MSRIRNCFKQLKSQNKKAFITYLTAGDPNIETSLNLMHALVKAGADIIELGYPFSDPSSDGAVIQRAVERSLAKHTKLKDIFTLVQRFREDNQDTPLVLMGYLNPIERMGYQHFADNAEEVGVDGLLVVDMPPEESHDLLRTLHGSELDCIFLVAPTTDEKRAKQICELSSGYVYYVSLKGVTGASHIDIDSVRTNVNRLKSYCKIPIGIGFGIKDAETAMKLGKLADAIVVGSALVNLIAELEDGNEYSREELFNHIALMADIRTALDIG
ncbi:MAG: tryptophan synthase subunit alpha [Pseudohongiellaceae bacterium]